MWVAIVTSPGPQVAIVAFLSVVNPRVGGEQNGRLVHSHVNPGSSPRGRGTVPHDPVNSVAIRFIPAWAGNSDALSIHLVPCSVHPRVGGEQ